ATYSCCGGHERARNALRSVLRLRPMAPPQELLANVDLFRDLDKRELREIADAMKEYTFSAGREIVTQGQDGVGFFVIADGTAKVTVDGGEVRTLQAGDYCGEIALLGGAPRPPPRTAGSRRTRRARVSAA